MPPSFPIPKKPDSLYNNAKDLLKQKEKEECIKYFQFKMAEIEHQPERLSFRIDRATYADKWDFVMTNVIAMNATGFR